jgi:hypothetical protein
MKIKVTEGVLLRCATIEIQALHTPTIAIAAREVLSDADTPSN